MSELMGIRGRRLLGVEPDREVGDKAIGGARRSMGDVIEDNEAVAGSVRQVEGGRTSARARRSMGGIVQEDEDVAASLGEGLVVLEEPDLEPLVQWPAAHEDLPLHRGQEGRGQFDPDRASEIELVWSANGADDGVRDASNPDIRHGRDLQAGRGGEMARARQSTSNGGQIKIPAGSSNGLDALARQVAKLQEALLRQSERVEQLSRLADRAMECHEDGFTMLESLTERYETNGIGTPEQSSYQQLVADVKGAIRRHVPRGSIVLVVSKGDPALVRIPGRIGWHFPRTAEGTYPGFHPHSSTTAIAALEALRAQGADYLVVPRSALWWVDHYENLFLHLEQRCRLAAELDVCHIYALREPPLPGTVSVRAQMAEIVAEAVVRHDRLPTIVDWRRAAIGRISVEADTVVADPATPLPFIDRSLDLVVTDSCDSSALSDARRVAAMGVVIVSPEAGAVGTRCRVDWHVPRARAGTPVSIVITAEGSAWDKPCLESLASTLPDSLDIEVVVVPLSEGQDAPLLSRRWRHPRHALHFAPCASAGGASASRIRGAELAKGEILIFVDSGTLLLPGWLPPLLRILRDRSDAGAVAPLELASDGRLLSAGRLVLRDGSVLAVGRDDHKVGRASLSHLRPVDMVSAGVLATQRHIFDATGGFPRGYAETLYADADYCFALRGDGRRVYCQPESFVVRLDEPSPESLAPGGAVLTDYDAFVKRWHDALSLCPMRHSDPVADALTLALHVPTDLIGAAAV